MKRIEKGNSGYIAYQKTLKGIITAVCFLIVIAIAVTGYIIFNTRNNILTVLAIVSVLPSAKIAVNFFMYLPHKNVDEVMKNTVESKDQFFLHKYECIFTTKDTITYVPALVITPGSICCYTAKDKCDAKAFEEALRKFVKEARLNVTVSLFTDEKSFYKRIELMNSSINDAPSQEDCDKMQWIWESVMCMCL